MPPPLPIKKQKPQEQTGEEPKYLKSLIDDKHPVRVKLVDDSEVEGVIEYYDSSFIRLTREGEPNLFLFKHFIKYIMEL
ncbi:MAG: RNA chaperone Hfq [Acidobacteria bacterium]|nr:RNA chaperone Hfq [Acidobacteriota bacterium]